jgi:hypothetical protein
VRREGSGVTSRPASGEWGTEKPRLCKKGEGMCSRCPGARKRYEVLIDESRVGGIWLGSLAKWPQGVRLATGSWQAAGCHAAGHLEQLQEGQQRRRDGSPANMAESLLYVIQEPFLAGLLAIVILKAERIFLPTAGVTFGRRGDGICGWTRPR